MDGKVKRWKFDKSTGYPSIVTKKPSKVSIGFEWEIHGDECGYNAYVDQQEYRFGYNKVPNQWMLDENGDLGTTLDTFSLKFAEMYSFQVHGECLASEFASPVFHRLLTAKAMANKLIKRANKDRFLCPDESDMAGIHVHTSTPEWCAHVKYFTDFTKLLMMFNRYSSEDFIRGFSGRDSYHDYYQQAEATCWDVGFSKPEDYHVDEAEEREMLRENRFSDNRTVEFRIWNGVADRLLPAIEFSHAATRFILQHKSPEIPYLVELKDWLGKQQGYKLLKSQPEWRYVN